MATNVTIKVKDNDIERALRHLRREVGQEGVLKRSGERYLKPSELRRMKRRRREEKLQRYKAKEGNRHE